MAKTKEQKKEILKQLQQNLEKQKGTALIDFSHLSSKELFDLRKKLKKNDCVLMVAKKTLLIKTLEKLKKKELADAVEKIKTQIALCFGFKDEVSPFKLCYEFLKDKEEEKIIGGILNFEFLSPQQAKEIALLPSRENLLAKLVGGLKSLESRFVISLSWNLSLLLNALENVKVAKNENK